MTERILRYNRIALHPQYIRLHPHANPHPPCPPPCTNSAASRPASPSARRGHRPDGRHGQWSVVGGDVVPLGKIAPQLPVLSQSLQPQQPSSTEELNLTHQATLTTAPAV